MENIKINDLTTTELEQLNLSNESEDNLQDLAEREEINIIGGHGFEPTIDPSKQ